MNDRTNGYELLLEHPGPPPETIPLLKRTWDARRTEDWLLNGTWLEGCSAPGEHLTVAGTDGAGRWAVHDGEHLRATDCEWLRHITEVQAVRRTWWRTRWQSWPARAAQTREPGEVRIALDCDHDSPVQMFQLYAALGDDQMPIGAPELRSSTRTPTRRCRPRRPSSSRPTGSRPTCSSGSRGCCSTAAAARRADTTARKRLPQAP